MPRRRAFLIIKFSMSKGASSKEEGLNIARVRGLLCAIFISNIVTAEGIHLENFDTSRPLGSEHVSKYKFHKEAPTQGDWTTRIQLSRQNTVGNFGLDTPLGEWIHLTHREWE